VSNYERPYLDSTVWSAALDSSDGNHDVARQILEAADEGKVHIVVSTMLDVEVLGGRHDE
jgi:predicted nucleic acid-binding protein